MQSTLSPSLHCLPLSGFRSLQDDWFIGLRVSNAKGTKGPMHAAAEYIVSWLSDAILELATT